MNCILKSFEIAHIKFVYNIIKDNEYSLDFMKTLK